MVNGPLIPGLKEFDGPRKGLPRFVWWILAGVAVAIAVLVLVGLFAGTGPARSLGLLTQPLQPVAYRPTTSPEVIQVAIAVPPEGLCRGDELDVRAFARSTRIEVSAVRTSPRNANCETTGIVNDKVWMDVAIDAPLLDRQVIRESDRQPLPRETGASLG